MNDLKDWELELLLDNINWSTKNEWEQTRMIMYASLMPHMKKGSIKDATDILPLPTDQKFSTEKYTHDYNISNEQIDRLKRKSERLEKIFKEKKKNG